MRGRRALGTRSGTGGTDLCKPDLVTYIYRNDSITRLIAGYCRFFTFTQCFDGLPECHHARAD